MPPPVSSTTHSHPPGVVIRRTQRHLAVGGGALKGVPQQVPEDLQEPGRIRADVVCRRCEPRGDPNSGRPPVPAQLQPPPAGPRERPGSRVSSTARLSWTRVRSSMSSMRRVSRSTFRRIIASVGRSVAGRRLVPRGAHRHQDRRKGCAELVAQRGEELVLRLAGDQQALFLLQETLALFRARNRVSSASRRAVRSTIAVRSRPRPFPEPAARRLCSWTRTGLFPS